jgi:hypothetical protein
MEKNKEKGQREEEEVSLKYMREREKKREKIYLQAETADIVHFILSTI